MDDEADRSRSCYERDSVGIGKEYIIIRLSQAAYDMFGTQNALRLHKMFEDGTLGRMLEQRELQKKKE